MRKRVIQVCRVSSPNRHNVRKKGLFFAIISSKKLWGKVDKLKAYFKPARYNRDCIINERRLIKFSTRNQIKT